MKKLAVLVFIFLFFDGQAWGVADTLQPTANASFFNQWTNSGCDNAFECVDDPPGSPDGNTTKLYTTTNSQIAVFELEDATESGIIDSIVYRMNAQRTGAVAESLNFVYIDPPPYSPNFVGYIILSTSYVDYSLVTTVDGGSNAWTNAKINACEFGVGARSVADGDQADLTQFFLIVYYAAAEGASKARERRLQNLREVNQ